MTEPLFIANVEELQAHLRLSGASSLSGSDFSSLLDQAIRKVRLNFLRRLGERIVLKAQADTGNFKDMAELAEIAWVRMELSYMLPMLFMDSGASARESYNDEAAFRKSAQEDLRDLRRALKMEVENYLRDLKDWGLDGPFEGRFKSFGPDRPTFPGQSIR